MEAEATSKNLSQRFAGANSGDDVELSLTLSLGGSFGTSKLVRSSSISSFPLFDSIKEENEGLQVGPTAQLHRTCSLPVPVPVTGDEEDDYRKRKEMQSLKRLEAKRKRFEKRTGSQGEDPGSYLLGPGSRAVAPGLRPLPQGSMGSVGSSSSNGGSMLGFDIVKFDCTPEVKSTSIPNETNQKTCPEKNAPRKIERRSSGMNEMERCVMEEMPCVSTRGVGPNGKKVDGFLYKYRKGEEVRIVCVCHGRFLTPAEFVMHAGGGAADHPLRHIVVSASPSPFL